MEELAVWVELVGNLGTIGILALAVYLGLTGKVVPAAFLREVITAVVSEVLDELEERNKL